MSEDKLIDKATALVEDEGMESVIVAKQIINATLDEVEHILLSTRTLSKDGTTFKAIDNMRGD